jgi:two-component system, cell cycle response regulator DivK
VKSRVLVVEDNLVNRELLRDWLEVEGFEVWPAGDLRTSYEVFAKLIPDVVLLDINLGHEDGLALVAWMRGNPKVSGVPVIAVTAHAMVTEQQRIYQSGCNACLAKPIDFNALRNCLRLYLGANEFGNPADLGF